MAVWLWLQHDHCALDAKLPLQGLQLLGDGLSGFLPALCQATGLCEALCAPDWPDVRVLCRAWDITGRWAVSSYHWLHLVHHSLFMCCRAASVGFQQCSGVCKSCHLSLPASNLKPKRQLRDSDSAESCKAGRDVVNTSIFRAGCSKAVAYHKAMQAGVALLDLIVAGSVHPGPAALQTEYKGAVFPGTLLPSGSITFSVSSLCSLG